MHSDPNGAPYRLPPRRDSRLYFGTVVVIAAVAALAIGTLALVLDARPLARGPVVRPGRVQAPTGAAADLIGAAEQVVPGMVYVDTALGPQGTAAAGTGIVLTPDGDVLTNNHVVDGATRITVTTLVDGAIHRAAVLGYDRADDLAVIRLDGVSGLPPAPLGDSGTVAVGDRVVGLGNAGGRGGDPQAAPGRVTALNRSITAGDAGDDISEQLTGLIQIAADIRPGDSGGPVVNTSAEVIGIDTAAAQNYRLGAGAAGQGFAIPITTATTVAKQIMNNQGSDTVHIGPAPMLGVTVGVANGGAIVRGVVAAGPADQLGLVPGDVIAGLDGRRVDSPAALTEVMDRLRPGDRVTVEWTDRSGQSHSGRTQLMGGPAG